MIENIGNFSPGQIQQMALQHGNSLERRAEDLKEGGDEAKIRKFSADFESLFLQSLLKEMRKGMLKGGLFEKSLSMEWFESMFDESIANEIAKGNDVGMAQLIYEQLTRTGTTELPSGNLTANRNRNEAPSQPGKLDADSGAGALRVANPEGENRE